MDRDVYISLISVAAGFLLAVGYDLLSKLIRARHELGAAGNLRIEEGKWFAAWQTSVNEAPNINLEEVHIRQHGASLSIRNVAVSNENPSGGFLWQADLKLYHARKVLGWYAPAKRGERDSMGTLYYLYFSSRKVFLGQWVGSAIDGELCRGYSVIGRSEAVARHLLEALILGQPMSAKVLSDLASSQFQEGGPN